MLRIYFSGDDLARTRIAPGPDPLWELVSAVQMLRQGRHHLLFAGWRRDVVAAVRATGAQAVLRLLTALYGYFPDFLNPIEAIHGLPTGLEAVRSTPRRVLHRDLSRLAASGPLPRAVGAVARGELEALVRLADGLSAGHAALVEPYRDRVETGSAATGRTGRPPWPTTASRRSSGSSVRTRPGPAASSGWRPTVTRRST